MGDYKITLTGKLARFTGHPEQWFMGETEVFFITHDQALDTPINVSISLSVDKKMNVYPGDGYYVLT